MRTRNVPCGILSLIYYIYIYLYIFGLIFSLQRLVNQTDPRAYEKHPYWKDLKYEGCEGNELKIKAKAPKSAKPAATGEKAPSPDFCSLKTTNHEIVKSLFLDVPDFNEISIRHTLKINNIELPKGETDPVKIRENAKRKGAIIRKVKIDDCEIIKEYNFTA